MYHFFEERFKGSLISSPLDTFTRESSPVQASDPEAVISLVTLGQEPEERRQSPHECPVFDGHSKMRLDRIAEGHYCAVHALFLMAIAVCLTAVQCRRRKGANLGVFCGLTRMNARAAYATGPASIHAKLVIRRPGHSPVARYLSSISCCCSNGTLTASPQSANMLMHHEQLAPLQGEIKMINRSRRGGLPVEGLLHLIHTQLLLALHQHPLTADGGEEPPGVHLLDDSLSHPNISRPHP